MKEKGGERKKKKKKIRMSRHSRRLVSIISFLSPFPFSSSSPQISSSEVTLREKKKKLDDAFKTWRA